jgi:hypothetical protein
MCDESVSKSLPRFWAMRGDSQHSECQDGPRWIRFERYRRYHAIYTIESGLYWTYCGRKLKADDVSSEVDAPAAQCRCCRSRLLRPYLVPEQMTRLRGNRA